MKPVAINIGRANWVIARTDDQGQPEVATIGEGGLIPSVIAEHNQALVLNQLCEGTSSIPVIRDIYRFFSGDSEYRSKLGERYREQADGYMELFVGGHWWLDQQLLARMLYSSVKVVKDYLCPDDALPVVLVIPPEVEPLLLSRIFQSLSEAELKLVAWCPVPVALAFCDPKTVQDEHAWVIVGNIDQGAFSLSLLEITHGLPCLRKYSSMEWSELESPPLEKFPMLFDRFSRELQEEHQLQIEDIDRLLIGGDESWVSHVYNLLSSRFSLELTSFSRPHLSAAMGGSLLADFMQAGLYSSPNDEFLVSGRPVIRGISMPGSSLTIKTASGQETHELSQDFMFELTAPFSSGQMNEVELHLQRPDNQSFLKHFKIKYKGMSPRLEKRGGAVASESTQPDLGVPDEMIESVEELIKVVPSNKFPIAESKEFDLLGASAKKNLAQGSGFTKVLQTPLAITNSDRLAQGHGATKVLQSPLSEMNSLVPLSEMISLAEGEGSTRIVAPEGLDALRTLSRSSEGLSTAESSKSSLVEEIEISEDDYDVLEIEEIQEEKRVVESLEFDLDSAVKVKPTLGISPSQSLGISLDQSSMTIAEERGVSVADMQAVLGSEFSEMIPEDHSELLSVESESTLGDMDKYKESDSSKEEESFFIGDDEDDELTLLPDASVIPKPKPQKAPVKLPEPQVIPNVFKSKPKPFEKEESLEDKAKKLEKARAEQRIKAKEKLFGKKEGTDDKKIPLFTKEDELQKPDSVDLFSGDRVRALKEKALSKVRKHEERKSSEVPKIELAEPEQKLDASVSQSHSSEDILGRLKQAHQLAQEARDMLEQAQRMAEQIDSQIDLEKLMATLADQKEVALRVEPSARREARKIMELARKMADVEQSRLPGSTRKIILRMARELESGLDEDAQGAMRTALQLANRLFDTIRRDLRPW